MDRHAVTAAFWARFLAETGHPDAPYQVGAFAEEHPALATGLAALVLAGTKRATAGLLAAMEAASDPLPRPGDLFLVTDGEGTPVCVIRTTSVEHRRFGDVDEAFAFEEGEGDRTLASWRRGHAWYFDSIGHPLDEDAVMLLERFEKLWP